MNDVVGSVILQIEVVQKMGLVPLDRLKKEKKKEIGAEVLFKIYCKNLQWKSPRFF